MHRELRGAAPWRVRLVAIEAVFGNVHVKAAQIHCAELIDGMINAMELEFGVSIQTGRRKILQPRKNPAIHKRQSAECWRLRGIVIMKVCQQNTKRVANAAVGIA